MHTKSIRALLSILLLVTTWVSLESRIPIVVAAIQIANTLQDSPGVEGNWRGALDVSGFKLRLVLKISKTADGKLTATVDSLDQSAKDLPVDTITFQDGTLKFEMKR